ncbi:intradiol ring-cleavage dioxygenase [Glycomyces algeriensis]|uniref:3,4-dioxygenase subunit beta n=1 Tax=Glycomyces algeriensis TaxID=256037 RepID=A0A9W6G9P1_9ACTN|nr:intradiol ring-cleavage dioxygenase [Glycomyces algeriensis]MDA1364811.1 intradiol ring-cleavage dioxygenase [Glycomyces algeriensis]MDR7350130.1 protocatechuate 3,4-dioxygenase beta subunit [Glycomyces algeriensis]GLI42842.1 3,4-dioxygenase subunit beta [Glycomyces algeriensis]
MRKKQLETPTYEGRQYAKRDEELVDQGLQFDIGTLLSRRGVLFAGAGAAVAGLAACGAADTESGSEASASTGGLAEIPEETAGPYPGDGSNGPDVLEESGIVRSDIRSSFGTGSATAEGVRLTLQFTVYDMANGNVPFEGVAVYAWHCTREGEYSMYGEGLESENFLRGVQIADADGVVSFTSVYPGCYSGRWPHVHFEVYPDEASITDSANAIATSQLAFPEDVCETVYAEEGYESSVENLAQITLESDNIFSDDGGESQMGTVSGDVANGYTVTLAVGVDTSTEAGGGGAAPSGGGGEPPSGEMPSGEPPSGEAPANNG